MKYLLLLFLMITLEAKETCYSVQLVSVSHKTKVLHSKYDNSCRIVDLGKIATVRCGCYNKYWRAKKKLNKMKGKYKQAYIVSTYKSIFDTTEIQSRHKKTQASPPKIKKVKKSIQESPIPLPKVEVMSIPSPVIRMREKEKSIKKIEETSVQEITPEKIETKKEEKAQKKAQKKKKKHKKKALKKAKKKALKKALKKAKKKAKKKALKKAKRKRAQKSVQKRNQLRYTRHKQGRSFYTKSIDSLRSKRARGRVMKYRYRFGAQMSYDAGYVDEARNAYTNNKYRRVRIFHQGSFFDKKLFYELEYSMIGLNPYKDNFIGFQNSISSLKIKYRIKTGNLKVPFSLERYTSSKNNMFMERALTDTFGIGRKLGAEILISKMMRTSRINLFTSLYSNSINQRIQNEVEQTGFSMRLTYAKKVAKNHIFTLGAAYLSQNTQLQRIKFSQSAESRLMRNKYISVSLLNADSVAKQNIEALYIYKKFSLQGEYLNVIVNAKNKTNVPIKYNFNAYYIQGSYFLTGRGRSYKFSNSSMGKVKLKRDGALELAMRYSFVNLNSLDEQNNGTQTDYNFGLNWYYNQEIKCMFNYVISEPKDTKLYDGRLQLLQTRILFSF